MTNFTKLNKGNNKLVSPPCLIRGRRISLVSCCLAVIRLYITGFRRASVLDYLKDSLHWTQNNWCNSTTDKITIRDIKFVCFHQQLNDECLVPRQVAVISLMNAHSVRGSIIYMGIDRRAHTDRRANQGMVCQNTYPCGRGWLVFIDIRYAKRGKMERKPFLRVGRSAWNIV